MTDEIFETFVNHIMDLFILVSCQSPTTSIISSNNILFVSIGAQEVRTIFDCI